MNPTSFFVNDKTKWKMMEEKEAQHEENRYFMILPFTFSMKYNSHLYQVFLNKHNHRINYTAAIK